MQLLNNNGTPCTASEMRHTLYSGDVYAGGGRVIRPVRELKASLEVLVTGFGDYLCADLRQFALSKSTQLF